jgi:hypothetical protein
VAGSCGHDGERSVSIKDRKFVSLVERLSASQGGTLFHGVISKVASCNSGIGCIW